MKLNSYITITETLHTNVICTHSESDITDDYIVPKDPPQFSTQNHTVPITNSFTPSIYYFCYHQNAKNHKVGPKQSVTTTTTPNNSPKKNTTTSRPAAPQLTARRSSAGGRRPVAGLAPSPPWAQRTPRPPRGRPASPPVLSASPDEGPPECPFFSSLRTGTGRSELEPPYLQTDRFQECEGCFGYRLRGLFSGRGVLIFTPIGWRCRGDVFEETGLRTKWCFVWEGGGRR